MGLGVGKGRHSWAWAFFRGGDNVNGYKLLVCWQEEDEKKERIDQQAFGCGQSHEFEVPGRGQSGTIAMVVETQIETGMAAKLVAAK